MAAEKGPWDDDCPTIEAETTPVFHGLDWETLRDVEASPHRCRSTILRLALLLAAENGGTTTVQSAASRIKASEVAVLEAISLMPTLFRLKDSAHKVELTRPGDDPNVESPRAIALRSKRDRQEALARERADKRAREDARDTPFNVLRHKIEELGLTRDKARDFAGHLTRTYGLAAARDAVEETMQNKPAEPKSYIIAVLKRRVAGALPGLARRTPSQTKPSGTRETILIGWSASEPRVKLYRKPSGTLIRVPPAANEKVPTLREDPGYVISG